MNKLISLVFVLSFLLSGYSTVQADSQGTILNVPNIIRENDEIPREDDLTDMAVSSDGKWLAAASKIGFSLIDNTTHQVTTFITCSSPINSIDFSNDSARIVIGMDDGKIAVYEVSALSTTGSDDIQPVLYFKAHSLPVTSVEFGKTSEVIISTSGDRTAVTWNSETGKRIHTFAGFDADISTLAFSPDYRFIAVGSYDGTIRIWNVTSGHLWKQYGDKDGTQALRAEYPSSLLFDAFSGRLVSGWGDGTIRIWQWEFGNDEAYTISLGENSIIDLIQTSTNTIISVDYYGNSILFNMASEANRIGVEKSQEFNLGESICCIEYAPEEQTLVIGRRPTSIDLFQLDGGKLTTIYDSNER